MEGNPEKTGTKNVVKVKFEDFSNICRTCLRTSTSKKIIWEKLDNTSIAVLLQPFVTSEISLEDNKPQSICTLCLETIRSFHKFSEKTKKNEEILNEALEYYNRTNLGTKFEFLDVFDQNDDVHFDIEDRKEIDDDINDEIKEFIDNDESIENFEEIESIELTEDNGEIEENDLIEDNEEIEENELIEDNEEIDENELIEEINENELIEDNEEIDENELADVINVSDDNMSNSSDDEFIKKLLKAVKTYKFKCLICSLEFDNEKLLLKHKKDANHNLNNRKVQCEKCGKVIYSRNIDIHMKSHERTYPCSICGKKFNANSTLWKHKKLHSLEKRFTCTCCKRGFYSQHSLDRHWIMHNPKERKLKVQTSYSCDVCAKTFTRYDFYQSHKKRHFEKPQDFNTQDCDVEMETHKYLCSFCPNTYNSYSGLKVHLAKHGDKKFKCQFCQQAFYHRNNLTSHLRKHTGEKPFACEICGKMFAHKTTFQVHLNQHLGLKPYQCNVCGKCFVQLSHLKQHQLIHTGEKPHTCEYCAKKFSTRANCLAHMRAHQGIKPYECDLCEKCFYDAGSRSKHKKKFHQEK